MFLSSFFVSGQLIISDSSKFEKQSLHLDASYFEDDKNISLQEVLSLPSHRFLKFENPNTNTSFTEHNFWIKFQISNRTNEEKLYFLETGRPITDQVDLYVLKGEKLVQKFKNGDLIPFSEKSVQHRKAIFEIEIPAHTTYQYFIHLKSDGEVINLPLLLRTAENFINATAFEQMIFGFFYGILGLAAIIYLFFFFGIRNRSFLYYGLYVVFIGLMQFSLDGYFHQYILPNGGFFSDRAVLIFASISTIFLGKYTETFLEIKKYNLLILRGYHAVYLASILVLILLFLIPSALSICYPAANAIGFVVLILIISSLVSVYRNTKKIDGFFTTGIFFLVLGFVIFILNNFSLITNSFLTENSPKFGTGLEIVFLSLSMSNLIKNLKDERENLQEIALQKSEEMNELKLYFLSNISHELRTPLNIILNLMDKISSQINKKSVRSDCDIVITSTQNLLSSVNDILDFSKIEKDEFVLVNESFNLVKLIDDVVKNYQYLSDCHGLKFEYIRNFNEDFQILGDRHRLRQVLSNLLNNAVKFTPSGTIYFKAEWMQKSDEETSLLLLISDTGIGISKQKRATIFNAFSQETIDNKRKYGGLGLGLYIVKKIVDESNGIITIESERNLGTTCKVELPFKKVMQSESKERVVDYHSHFKDKSILVVEDNLLNQLVLKKILKEFDQTKVEFANNGLECLQKLRLEVFDIILMDLQMPEMDGCEASTSIRNGDLGDEFKDIPIIAITADIMESTKKRVFEIGIDSYLSKPIEKTLLFEEIYKLIVAKQSNNMQ